MAAFAFACECHELSVAVNARAAAGSTLDKKQQLAAKLQESLAMATGPTTIEWLAGYCVFLLKRHRLEYLLGRHAFRTAMHDHLGDGAKAVKRRRGLNGGGSVQPLSTAALRRSHTAEARRLQRGSAPMLPRRNKSA